MVSRWRVVLLLVALIAINPAVGDELKNEVASKDLPAATSDAQPGQCSYPQEERVPRPKYYLHVSQDKHKYVLGLVEETLKALGYVPAESVDDDWSVMWAWDWPFGPPALPAVANASRFPQPGQKVNQIQGSQAIVSKSSLSQMSDRLHFIPRTFRLPDDYQAFVRFLETPKGKSMQWMKKSGKHGNVKVSSSDDPELAKLTAQDNMMVQQRVVPHLMDRRSWDFGVFAVVTSLDPLRLYTYDNIVVRGCPELYPPGGLTNDSDPRQFVIHGDSCLGPWQLTALQPYLRQGANAFGALRAYLAHQGCDVDKWWIDVRRSIIQTFLAGLQAMMDATSQPPGARSSFFSLFRFDFMMDDKFKNYLIEVNMSPNLVENVRAQPPAPLHVEGTYNTCPYVGRRCGLLRVIHSVLKVMGLAEDGLLYGRPSERGRQSHGTIMAHEAYVGYDDICHDCTSREDCATALETMDYVIQTIGEHRVRDTMMRLFPPSKDVEDATYGGLTAPGWHNYILRRWIQLKCKADFTWC